MDGDYEVEVEHACYLCFLQTVIDLKFSPEQEISANQVTFLLRAALGELGMKRCRLSEIFSSSSIYIELHVNSATKRIK